MEYGKIIGQAWKIAWQYKALWLFVLVVSIPGYLLNLLVSYIEPLVTADNAILLYIGTLGITFIVSVTVTLIMGIGTIRGIYIAATQSPNKLTLVDIFQEIPPWLGRMVKIYLLSFAAYALIIGASAISSWGFGAAGSFINLAMICVLFPVIIIGGIIYYQIIIAMLVDDLSVSAAIRQGWRVVWNHLGEFIVIILILLAISIGLLIVAGIPFACILSVFVNNFSMTNITEPAALSFQMPWGVYLFSAILAGLSMLLSVFFMAVFVLTYLELTQRHSWKLPRDLREPPMNTLGTF